MAITVTLYQEQLTHTIRQVLHRAGENVKDEDLRATVQMDESKSDVQLTERLIQTGVARLKLLLKEHLTEQATTADDTLQDPDSWQFDIDLDGDGQSLANLMHWFVVWWALKGLLPVLGLTALAESAAAEVEEAEELIDEELVSLAMPIKERRDIDTPDKYAPIITIEDGN